MDILDRVTAFLTGRRVQAYLVGGSVRDRLLGRAETRDLDLAVAGHASKLARAFADAEGGAFYLMDAEHNVARVIFGDKYVDFAELRGDLVADLSTRDFAVNAMACPLLRDLDADLGSTLVDPYNGRSDLQSRSVRALSDMVFIHDPVRLLRAVRIAGELGFSVEPGTEALMRRDASLLARASMERARDEFFKVLALPGEVAVRALRQMDELGLLGALLPELAALKGVTQSAPHAYDAFEHSLRAVNELCRIQDGHYVVVANGAFPAELQAHFARTLAAERTRGTLLRFTMLLHDIGKAQTRSVDAQDKVHFIGHEDRGARLAEDIMRRLRLSRGEIETAERTIREHLRPAQLARAPHVTNRAVYRFFRDTGDNGIDVCVLSLADSRGKAVPAINESTDARLRDTLTTLLERYYGAPDSVITPPTLIDGRTLMQELNLPPGPQVGQLLESIREAQAGGEVSSREEALALARRIITQAH